MENIVKSKNLVNLIIEGAEQGKRMVKVTFVPPFDDPDTSRMKTLPVALVEELNKSKVEYFDIIQEGHALPSLLNSKDVIKTEWI